MSKQNIRATIDLVLLIAGSVLVWQYFGWAGGTGLICLAVYAKTAVE